MKLHQLFMIRIFERRNIAYFVQLALDVHSAWPGLLFSDLPWRRWYEAEMRSTETLKLLCSKDFESCSFLLRLAKKVFKECSITSSNKLLVFDEEQLHIPDSLNELFNIKKR